MPAENKNRRRSPSQFRPGAHSGAEARRAARPRHPARPGTILSTSSPLCFESGGCAELSAVPAGGPAPGRAESCGRRRGPIAAERAPRGPPALRGRGPGPPPAAHRLCRWRGSMSAAGPPLRAAPRPPPAPPAAHKAGQRRSAPRGKAGGAGAPRARSGPRGADTCASPAAAAARGSGPESGTKFAGGSGAVGGSAREGGPDQPHAKQPGRPEQEEPERGDRAEKLPLTRSLLRRRRRF